MFINNDKKRLCDCGKKFLNSNMDDNLLDYIPNPKVSFIDKFLSFTSSKRKQKFLKSIVYQEIIQLQYQLKFEKNKIIDTLNNGDISKFRLYIQQNQEKFPPFIMYSLDYIIDEYDIDIFSGTQSINLNDISVALAFVYLKEVLFHILQNDSILVKHGREIDIIPTEDFAKELKKRWLAIQWEKGSENSFYAQNIKIFLKSGVQDTNSYIKALSVHLMDKALYLNGDYFASEHFNLQYMSYMKKLCTLFGYLLYGFYFHIEIQFKNNFRFSNLGLDEEFINSIVNDNKSKKALNKGFVVNGNIISYIDGSSIFYIIRTYFYSYMTTKGKNNLGSIFEEYIYNYIKKQPQKFEAYEIYKFDKTFTDTVNNKKIKLDIDLILYDKLRNKYFLLQVKYSIFGKAYLKEEVHHFCNNTDLIQKGVKQLNTFSYFYNKDNQLKEELHKIGIVNLDTSNTYLILVHTLPVFDFSEIDGVILYDWNTFRNLLQYGFRINIPQNLTEYDSITQSNQVLELEKLDTTIDYLLESTIIDKNNNITLLDGYIFFTRLANFVETRNYKIYSLIK